MGRGRKRTSYSGPASNWPRARCTPASVQLGHAMLHSRFWSIVSLWLLRLLFCKCWTTPNGSVVVVVPSYVRWQAVGLMCAALEPEAWL